MAGADEGRGAGHLKEVCTGGPRPLKTHNRSGSIRTWSKTTPRPTTDIASPAIDAASDCYASPANGEVENDLRYEIVCSMQAEGAMRDGLTSEVGCEAVLPEGMDRTVVPMQDSTVSRSAAKKSSRRRRVLLEFALLTLLYIGYALGRAWVSTEPSTAIASGRELLGWERFLHIDIEASLNQAVSATAVVAVIACLIYATLHYLITPAAMVWLFRSRPGEYTRARSTLAIATASGLVVYAIAPVAPPRLLPGDGFIDTMSQYAAYGWWGDAGSAVRGMQELTNQYAALPSLHVGWAVWVALVMWRGSLSRWIRALAVGYPVLISVVVVVTGNHYLIDILAGALLVLGSDALVTLVRRVFRSRAASSPELVTQRPTISVVTDSGNGSGQPPSPVIPAVAVPRPKEETERYCIR